MAGRKLLVIACIAFLGSCLGVKAAEVQFTPAPLIEGDWTSKLPRSIQNLLQSTGDLNRSLSSWSLSRESFKGAGARLGETIRTTFRTIGFIILNIFAWLVSVATIFIFWTAGIIIIIIQWIIDTIRI
ncbi:MAG: hypothetical protein FJY98_02775 [Candidatus Liptonbacteria bacterium]|nr:hypothetical protein [Candidatus Liptonbacteria bacterium]